MTPIEIFEYKMKWMDANNNATPFHSDHRQKAKDWCKANVKTKHWHHIKFSNVYEDTMYFEYATDSELFSNYLKKSEKKG